MEQVDCVVVGAGVVGLAVAREMALQGRETILLEREDSFGTISSAAIVKSFMREFITQRIH